MRLFEGFKFNLLIPKLNIYILCLRWLCNICKQKKVTIYWFIDVSMKMCQKGTFEKRYQAQVYHSFFNNFNPCTLNQMLNFDVATRERCRGLTGLREWGWTHFIDGELEHEHGPPPWRGPEACQVSTLNKSGDIGTGKPMQYQALTSAIDTHSILAKNKLYFCESLTLAP